MKTAEQIQSEVETAVRQRVETFLRERSSVYLEHIEIDLQGEISGGLISPANEPQEYLAMRVRCVLGDMNLI